IIIPLFDAMIHCSINDHRHHPQLFSQLFFFPPFAVFFFTSFQVPFCFSYNIYIYIYNYTVAIFAINLIKSRFFVVWGCNIFYVVVSIDNIIHISIPTLENQRISIVNLNFSLKTLSFGANPIYCRTYYLFLGLAFFYRLECLNCIRLAF
ncbi:hypothetical protein L9F63_002996, partial [Diploptera punctata]